MILRSVLIPLGATLILGGCAPHMAANLPHGDAAYQVAPAIDKSASPTEYQIVPGDEVELHVVDEPDLNLEKLIVDQAGHIQVPLIGSIQVSGSSPAEASRMITARLKARYIRDPQVALNVTTPSVRYVTVEGQVNKAGTYPVTPETTLLSAISMAQSPSRIAKLNEVVVFRTNNGVRMAARFDLARIRAGREPDPQIRGGDVVTVGFSQTKSAYRDLIQALPLIYSIFVRL